MGLLYTIYVILSGILFLFLLPFLLMYVGITGRYRRHLGERLGWIPPEALRRLGHGTRIWIHAVSLGEVRVAESIIGALRQNMPTCSVLVSTMTEHGRALAEERFGEDIPVVYAPVDFIACFRIALGRVRPDVMVFLETEIWPAWLSEARRLGIPTALVNGRISVRSIGGYRRLRPFFWGVLQNVDAFSMISTEDAARIRSIGAPPHRIEVNGNAKYDIFAQAPDPRLETEIREILALDQSEGVIVAGSTRQGEEEIILNAYVKALEVFPKTILIIVPRHIDRTGDIASMIRRRGLPFQLRTEIGKRRVRTEKVIIINTFGELFKIYSIATIVFCGASLAPLGGQNPLEPAVWGKPVLYGPSMEDFLDAKDLLETSRASIPVLTPEELGEKIVWLLGHPEEARAYGERAREATLRNQGAALKHARVIASLAKRP